MQQLSIYNVHKISPSFPCLKGSQSLSLPWPRKGFIAEIKAEITCSYFSPQFLFSYGLIS